MLLYQDIIKDDNPILRNKSEDVTLPLSDEDIATIEKINEYLVNGYDKEKVEKFGIRPAYGLAAPQIGVFKKIFVKMCIRDNPFPSRIGKPSRQSWISSSPKPSSVNK